MPATSSSRCSKQEASKKSCHDYCCSAFALLEGEKLTKAADLDNPILSVLRRANFPENFNYATFEPSLRLASRFLQSNAAMVYLNTLFDGEYRDGDGKLTTSFDQLHTVTPEGVVLHDSHASMHPRPGQETANVKTRQRADQILEQMAEMVEFSLITDAKDEEKYSGSCQYLEEPLPLDAYRAFPRGRRTRIEISGETYNRLAFLTDMYAQDPNIGTEDLLLSRVECTQLIVHELGHAFNFAAYGCRSTELFYNESPLSEAGYELEAQLFGGVISWQDDIDTPRDYMLACDESKKVRDQGPLVFLREWPSCSVLEHYDSIAAPLGCRRAFRDYDVIWRIPLSYFESLFTTEFWNNNPVPHAPKIASWLFSHDDEEGQLLVISFAIIEEDLGWKRARVTCSCDMSPPEHRPEEIPDDVGEILATTGRWFALSPSTRTGRRKRRNRAPKH